MLAGLAFAASFAWLHHDNPIVMMIGVAAGLLTVFMHRGNIVRLLRGEERKTNLFGKGNQK